MAVYPIEWTIAWMVAMRATFLWKMLKVEKLQPVSHRKMLFLPENIHRIGKLA